MTEIKTLPNNNQKDVFKYCLITAGIFWFLAVILWFEGGIDKAVLLAFDANRVDYDFLIQASKFMSDFGMAIITALYILVLAVSQIKKWPEVSAVLFLLVIFSLGLTGIGGDLLKEVFNRPRPIAIFAGQILAISDATSPAIPSGHTTKAFALIVPILFAVDLKSLRLNWLKILFVVLAAGVGLSRILLGAHYVSDVLAGVGTAFLGFPLVILFSTMILKQTKPEQLSFLIYVWGALLVFLTGLFIVM